jgi:hypothetical protein
MTFDEKVEQLLKCFQEEGKPPGTYVVSHARALCRVLIKETKALALKSPGVETTVRLKKKVMARDAVVVQFFYNDYSVAVVYTRCPRWKERERECTIPLMK